MCSIYFRKKISLYFINVTWKFLLWCNVEVLKKQSEGILVQAIHFKQRHKNILNFSGRKSIGGTCTHIHIERMHNPRRQWRHLSFHLSFCASPSFQIWIYCGAWVLDQFSSTASRASKRVRRTWRIIKRSARRGNV